MHGSDEEGDDHLEVDSDEDLSDDAKVQCMKRYQCIHSHDDSFDFGFDSLQHRLDWVFYSPLIMQMEGSVDEESTKSDEEYDDLAMQDIQENGYFTDDEFDSYHRLASLTTNTFR